MNATTTDAPCKVLREDITVLLTNQCGNQCKHCIPESGTLLEDEMAAAVLIRSLPDLRTHFGASGIALSGGEPLLRPEFRRIYEAAFKVFGVTLFSSGIGLARDLMALFRELPPKRVITSLYGLRTSHDAFCNRNGAFSDVERCLNFFMDIGSPTTVNLVCHQANLAEIPRVIDHLCARRLADTMKILVFSPLGRGADLMSLAVGSADWVAFTCHVCNHVMRRCPDRAESIEIERHVRHIEARDRKPPCPCAVSVDRGGVFSSCIHVDANGDIFPCVMLLRNPQFRLGNITRPDAIDLDSYYQRVKDARSNVTEAHCSQCQAVDECSGGCLGYHIALGKDYRCGTGLWNLGCPTRYEPLIQT